MNAIVMPGALSGTVAAIPSKSQAHRLLLCAALAGERTVLICPESSEDIDATIRCIRALGCAVERTEREIIVTPPGNYLDNPALDCGQSGSTLRFLLPVVCALGCGGHFRRAGRLPRRPLSPLYEELSRNGAALSAQTQEPLTVAGTIAPGTYTLPGDVSSQYISGLLFALPLLKGDSTLTVTGRRESAPYIEMTLRALRCFSIVIHGTQTGFEIPGGQRYCSPGTVAVEGDWSNAAFWLCAGALGGPVTVTGLDAHSPQGDRACVSLLRRFGAEVTQTEGAVTVRRGNLRGITVDASDTPDLVPVLSVLAGAAEGETVFANAARLRLKESDRIESTCAMLRALGVETESREDGFTVFGRGGFTGGTVNGWEDHRIVMAASVAACAADGPVTITGAEASDKSYPGFFKALESLRKNIM